MAFYSYKQLLKQSKICRNNVKTKFKLDMSDKWCYYFAKVILNPKKDIEKITFANNPNPQQDKISRYVTKSEYKKIAKDLVDFVEKEHRLPNYVEYKGFKVSPRLLTYTFSKIIVKYNKNDELQSEVIINNKVFVKPVETGNVVYDYTCNKFGKRFKTIDELLTYVKAHFHYQKYFDDYKSNKEVADSKSGNCVDLLQWFMNNATAMGYSARCIHVKCRKSGTGHVFGEFKHPKHTGGEWIRRDVASVADGGSITSIWCGDGYVQAVNPKWYNGNLHR